MYTPEEKRQRNLQRLRELRPIDDDFMRCLFKDNIPLAQLVLRIITGKRDLIITECQTQRDMKRLGGARSVCLDAYGTDSQGRKYDLEIQRDDKGAGPHRARYHSSVLDIENLDAGQEFEELPETYVIFISEKDIFGSGKPVYPVERINLETGEPFEDGEHILYVNGEYRGDSDMGKLMFDFCCAEADKMNFPLMADGTRYLKESEGGTNQMCRIMEDIKNEGFEEGVQTGMQRGMQQGMQQGMQKGMEEGIKFTAVRMLQAGKLALEEVAAISGLPLEEIKKLQAEQKA